MQGSYCKSGSSLWLECAIGLTKSKTESHKKFELFESFMVLVFLLLNETTSKLYHALWEVEAVFDVSKFKWGAISD